MREQHPKMVRFDGGVVSDNFSQDSASVDLDINTAEFSVDGISVDASLDGISVDEELPKDEDMPVEELNDVEKNKQDEKKKVTETTSLLAVGGGGADQNQRLLRLERAVNKSNFSIATLKSKNQKLQQNNQKLQALLKTKENNDKKREKRTKQLIHTYSQRMNTKNLRTLSEDVYSFMFCSPMCSTANMIGSGTIMLQFGIFGMFLSNMLMTQQIPANVETIVRIAQVVAILVTFVAQTDIRVSLRALIYQEGVEETADDFPAFSKTRFIVANVLMFVQGLLGIIVSLALIVYTDNVFDLLLNFTAVLFVSELDELVFYMARHGYLGDRAENLAKDIQEMEFNQVDIKGVSGHIHVILFVLLMIGGYVFWGFILESQISNSKLPVHIKAEFGDSIDPSLGLYSGCYEIRDVERTLDNFEVRVEYVQIQQGRGQGTFAYCYGDVRSWSFTPMSADGDNRCEETYLASTEERPTSFDILDAAGDIWKLKTGNPIQSFQLTEVEEDRFEYECGDVFGNGEQELCPILTMAPEREGFSGDRDWSKNFNMIEFNGEPVYFYQHPIYVGEFVDPNEGLELIFFTGRRWLLASAKSLFLGEETEDKDFSDLEEVYTLLTDNIGNVFHLISRDVGAYAFVSESVDGASDQGTPLGLRWYHTRYADNSWDIYPFADTSRPVDAFFSCGKCDTISNPCRFEGVCNDGVCDCAHGATGKLCEIKPLSNGVCNTFFNKGPDDWDGGDCCVSTCEDVSCGIGIVEEAFGQELRRAGNGFPHCLDPEMVPLSIVMNHTVDRIFFEGEEDATGGDFESYVVEIRCNGGEEIPLRVALDPQVTGESSQTIYLADSTEGCAISVLGIQVESLFNATVKMIDGYPASNDTDKPSSLMSEVRGVVADGSFAIPPMYAKCLKDTLKDAVDPSIYYTGNYQDEALTWLNNEISNGRCFNTKEWLTQRYAFVALWRASVDPVEWVDENDQCLWSKITCKGIEPVVWTSDGGTTGRLTGTLASEIGLLTNLERVDVFKNPNFSGEIPSEIGLLTKMTTLSLSENAHSGTLPTTLGQLKSLQKMLIWYNWLKGSIPTEVGLLTDNLIEINLQQNFLNGPLPSELGQLTTLERLTLITNEIDGTIPKELGDATSLTNIVLTRNLLTGSIPDLTKLKKLDTFIVFQNQLSGTLPGAELADLPALSTLNLSTNNFSGSIPAEWATLTGLSWLIANKNALTGTIPDFFGTAYPKFSRLVLDGQSLTGSLPDTFGNLSNMARIRVQNNQLTGPIKPEVMGGWTSMGQLRLSKNQFTGSLPSEFGAMTSTIDYFDCFDNNFEGKIPDELWQATNLLGLFMQNNQFSGTIATEVGLLSNLWDLDLSGNQMSGTIPSEIGLMSNLLWLSVLGPNMNMTGTVPQEVCDLLTTNGADSDVLGACASGATLESL